MTTVGIMGEDIRDFMVTDVERRFSRLNRLPRTIEWLTDNGSCYMAADTRRFAREIGFLPLRTPIGSPQSSGWPKLSCESSNAIMWRSIPSQTPRPSSILTVEREAPIDQCLC
ncbi:hypothetical protein ACELLULO517_16145 [Acidisoma cellulosilytica]|uniref:Integrase catalytic domain-containing protein n=1 Tax=Acidisoma cellulosilyticum TaxID=2802395 RepID=A0A963Z381_9PROT|nr:hypothetical protein [Acidisoma cellulosilyticum]